MVKRSDINVTMTFHPKEGTKCGYCGICSFAHRHKAGTLPKDFERIDERQSTKQKDTECNCIMSGYAQTTNCCPLHKAPKFMEDDLQKEYNKNTHSNKTNAYPKMNFIQEELKRFDEEIYCRGDKCKWCKGVGGCGSGVNPDNAKAFLRTSLISLIECLKKIIKDTVQPLDLIDNCESDCTKIRHARHVGSWEAHLKLEEQLDKLFSKLKDLGGEKQW